MTYQVNIINNNQPVFEELDEFIVRLIDTVATNSTSGDLGSTSTVDIAFTDENLQNLENTSGETTLISVSRDNQNPNNLDLSRKNSYTVPFWAFVYNIYIRVPAERNNQAKLERITKEIIDAVCLNESDGTPYQETLEVSDNWSGATYQTILRLNRQIGQTIFEKESFADSTPNYYTAVIQILFKIKKN